MGTKFLIVLIAYLLTNLITLYAIDYAHTMLMQEQVNRKKISRRDFAERNQPTARVRESLKFTKKDKRLIPFVKYANKFNNFASKLKITKEKPYKGEPPKGITYRMGYYLIIVAGIPFLLLSFTHNWYLAFISVLFPWFAVLFSYVSSKKILKRRGEMLERMFGIGRSSLGYPQRPQKGETIGTYVSIINWDQDEKPSKVTFKIPTSFNSIGEKPFLKLFNQHFGREVAWIPDNNTKDNILGWDYDRGVLTLKTTPPIPAYVDWAERYALGEDFAWSFFPLGLSSIGGYEVPNPVTGEIEHVVGIDISGEQKKIATKKGYDVDDSVVPTPMILIAGVTGSGKAYDINTPVLRKKNRNNAI